MYDYHISDNLGECAKFSRELGWEGLCYVIPAKDFDRERSILKKLKTSLDIALGVLIEAEKMNEVRKLVDSFRSKTNLIFVKGGDAELNRYIFNMPKVDVVTDVANNDRLDHVMCRLAAEHSIAIEFCFIDLLQSYSKSRARILSNMNRNAELVRKFRSPFVITSGALSKWDMRSPHDIMVFGRTLGFQDPELKEAISGEMIDSNRKRFTGKIVMKGVERI